MKLALIGCDEEACHLLRQLLEAGAAPRYELLAAYDAGPFNSELQNLAPLVRLDDDWEDLLLRAEIELVIVAQSRLETAAENGYSGKGRRFEQHTGRREQMQ